MLILSYARMLSGRATERNIENIKGVCNYLMKKKVFIIILVIFLLIVAIATTVYLGFSHRMVGHTTKMTNAEGKEQTFVSVGATSKLYMTWDSDSSEGTFLDIFHDVAKSSEDLGTLIDEGGFPYTVRYEALTTSEPTRYLVETNSGSDYWVEP